MSSRTRQVPVAPVAIELGGCIGEHPRRQPITCETTRPASRVTQWISRQAILQARLALVPG